MKLLAQLTIVLFFSTASVAQTNKYIYFNSSWQETTRSNASFYRVVKLNNNGNYVGVITDYYMDGTKQCQFKADYYTLSCGSDPLACGMKNGYAIWYYKNGNPSRTVRYKSGKPYGITEQNINGDFTVAVGCVAGDCINGEGLVFAKDGSYYKGDFASNNPHGYGKISLANGYEYEGKFINGKPSQNNNSWTAEDIKDGLEIGLLLYQIYQ